MRQHRPVPLAQRFQDLIDAIAMREGATESEAYLAGWAHGPETDRPGGAARSPTGSPPTWRRLPRPGHPPHAAGLV